MFDILVVSHGTFAKSLVETAQLVFGQISQIKTLGFNLGDSIDDLAQQVDRCVTESLEKGDVLVLTDMRSGSPYNVTVQAMCQHNIKHISGINLPLFLEILSNRDYMTVQETVESVMEIAPDTIADIGKLLEGLD